MKRKFVFKTILLFSLAMLFAAPEYGPPRRHKNFHGKRMLDMDEEGGFRLLFVKTNQFPDTCNFTLVFSEPVNPESITEESFLLNGNPIKIKKIRLSKNYRAVDFFIRLNPSFYNDNHNQDNSEMLIKDIESINGKKIEPVLIKNFQFEQEYRFIREKERIE